MQAARAAGLPVMESEFPGAERLVGRRRIGRARSRRATTDRRTLEVYLYGRERQLLDTLAAREVRSASNLLAMVIARGLSDVYTWPEVHVQP
jgi:hypothetical protein